MLPFHQVDSLLARRWHLPRADLAIYDPIKILVTYDGPTNRTGKIVEVRAAHGERLCSSRTQKRSVAAARLRDISYSELMALSDPDICSTRKNCQALPLTGYRIIRHSE